MQFGEHKNGVFHPTVGADPIATLLRRGWGRSSARKKRTGHSLAIGAEEDGRSQAEVRLIRQMRSFCAKKMDRNEDS